MSETIPDPAPTDDTPQPSLDVPTSLLAPWTEDEVLGPLVKGAPALLETLLAELDRIAAIPEVSAAAKKAGIDTSGGILDPVGRALMGTAIAFTMVRLGVERMRTAREQATADDQRRWAKQDRYRIAFVALCLLLVFATLVAPEGIPEWLASAPAAIGAASLLGFAWFIRREGRRDR